MLHCFFSGEGANAVAESLPSCTLLSGPSRSGKTSLLFQLAYNTCGKSDTATVVFICKRQNVERKPPVLSEDVDADSEVFGRVQMKYVKGDDEVRRYFAAFHLHEKIPTTVIIDDLVDLFDELESRECYRQARGWEIGIVRTLALCRDAMNYASQIAGVDCKLIISDTNINQGPRLLYIYQRWFTLILTVESIGSSFVLKVFQDSRCIPACKGILAQYTVSQQFLRLEMLR